MKEIRLAQASCLQLDICNATVLCIYRSPSYANTDDFVDSLSTHLVALASNKNVVIAGDININIKPKATEMSHEHKNRLSYLNMLSFYGILPGHTLPTREKNCLDHFMLKIDRRKFSARIAILQTTITDHFTTFLSLTKLKRNSTVNRISTHIDYEMALSYLLQENLPGLLVCEDPNLLVEALIKKLTKSIQNSTTTTKIPKSKRIIKPWITAGILRCIKHRNNLQK